MQDRFSVSLTEISIWENIMDIDIFILWSVLVIFRGKVDYAVAETLNLFWSQRQVARKQ